jgi:hypothetical protein
MLLIFEKEIWISQFASRLAVVQPRFPLSLAREVATTVWPYLGMLRPADAVETLFSTAMESRQAEDDDDGFPSLSA